MKRVEKAIESKVKISDLSNITSYDGAYALGITPVGIGQYKSGKISLEKINEAIKEIDGKQDILKPGNGIIIDDEDNISIDLEKQLKTINGNSLIGTGNIEISSGPKDLPLEKGAGEKSIQTKQDIQIEKIFLGLSQISGSEIPNIPNDFPGKIDFEDFIRINNINTIYIIYDFIEDIYFTGKLPSSIGLYNGYPEDPETSYIDSTIEYSRLKIGEYAFYAIKFLNEQVTPEYLIISFNNETKNGGESLGNYSVALGKNVMASSDFSNAEGFETEANGIFSHAEGFKTEASGEGSHAEGKFTLASGEACHAEGDSTVAVENYSHAEGYNTMALGLDSHAEGSNTISQGGYSHSEGNGSQALGEGSHAGGGYYGKVGYFRSGGCSNGAASFAHGTGVVANNVSQASFGYFNLKDETNIENFPNDYTLENSKNSTIFSIGNGYLTNDDYTYPILISKEDPDVVIRRDVVNIKHGGDVFIQGIGNFDGQNISSKDIKSLQTVLNESSSKTNGIAIRDNNTIIPNYPPFDEVSNNDRDLMKGEVFNIYKDIADGRLKGNKAPGMFSHAEGYETISKEYSSHAEGNSTKALGLSSHSEGVNTTSFGSNSHIEGSSLRNVPEEIDLYDNSIILAEWGGESTNTKFSLAKGESSHVEGSNNLALGNNTHAEGLYTKAIGGNAHSEGYFTEAVGGNAHAEGNQTKALGDYSHSGGYKAIANGKQSLAFGNQLEANKNGSIALGFGIINNATYSLAAGSKLSNQNEGEFSCGTYNLTGDNVSLSVGNGTSNARSNAFKINRDGKAYYQTSCTQGADYAEMFEWEDGNVDNEDRIGYFVKINNDKISKATSTSNIIGVISSSAGVIGDNPDQWHSMYLNDEWGRPIYEDIEEITIEPEMQEDGTVKEIEVKTTSRVRKLNPEYDPSIIYESREKRKEWDSVGLLGKLLVRQDGTLNVGNHCTSNNEGIATKSETGFYVMKVISDKIVQILFK